MLRWKRQGSRPRPRPTPRWHFPTTAANQQTQKMESYEEEQGELQAEEANTQELLGGTQCAPSSPIA
jgi:hypothetical protein